MIKQDTPTISCCSSDMGDTMDRKQNMRDFLDESMQLQKEI